MRKINFVGYKFMNKWEFLWQEGNFCDGKKIPVTRRTYPWQKDNSCRKKNICTSNMKEILATLKIYLWHETAYDRRKIPVTRKTFPHALQFKNYDTGHRRGAVNVDILGVATPPPSALCVACILIFVLPLIVKWSWLFISLSWSNSPDCI